MVVLTSFFESKEAREVGEAMRLTAANVRVIRHRAMERLRDRMRARSAA